MPTGEGGQRRNQARSVMFSLRLTPDELAELEAHAEQAGLPARTLARAWIVQRMRTQDDDQSLARRVARLEQAVLSKQ